MISWVMGLRICGEKSFALRRLVVYSHQNARLERIRVLIGTYLVGHYRGGYRRAPKNGESLSPVLEKEADVRKPGLYSK